MKGTKQIYMKYYSKKQWTQKLTVMVLLSMALGGPAVQAMPSGADIRSGQGSISQDGKNMTVQQNSQRMAIDWTKFDIAKDETVRYAQPDRNAISLNRVTGGQQSVIAGNLNANGNVVLVNPNGVVFTKNSSVDVGGLVASTARLNDEAMKNFSNGKDSLGLSLDKNSTAAVINEGQIKAQGGLVALHAANVENKGTITNEGGTLAMAAAKNLTLSAADDDKLNFTVDGELAKSQALNSGSLKADGGYVVMTAKSAGDVLSTVVNNTGTIEAKTLRKNEKGQILLDGGDNGQVEVSGTLDASGTEEGQSAGNIKVIGEKTIVHDGTNLLARGNVNGGKIETSGDVLNLGDNLTIDAKGVSGKAGEWLLDPLDVYICDEDPTTKYDPKKIDIKKYETDGSLTSSTSIGYNDPAATDANASSVNSAVTWISTAMVENMLNAGTNVTVQAAATNGNANIIVSSNIDKTLGNDATLTLDAMRNITVNGNISSTSNKLNVVLNADSDGDKIGAVIINANINTNGGDFTSASGGTVTYTSDKANTKGYGKGTLGDGKADPEGYTVGTYFGHVNEDGTADGKKDDRLIQTKGGKITLNGEIAIGLNGGTLTLDSGGGAVTATGIINSGNSYGAYVYGTTTWDELTADKVNDYLTSDTVPAYHYQGVNYVKNSDGSYATNDDGSYKTTTDAADFSNGEPHYTFDKETDTQNIRWLGDGSSTAVSLKKGKGYSSVIVTEGKMSTKEYLQYVVIADPAGFLSRYMTSNPTITVGSTSYALTVKPVTVNGVSNNALGYKVGNKFTTLTQQQIQSLADGALTLAKNSTDTTAMSNGITAYTNLTNDIKRLIASNWFVSETLAKYDPKTKTYNNGKSAVGDSYLATITTVLENSLTTPNGQQILWAGGRGSGVLKKTGSTNNDKLYPYSYWGMPDDPTYQDGMYWVTGPEGEANGGKGTQFYSNAGSDWGTVSLGSDGKTYTYNQGNNVYGYVNWDTWPEKVTGTDKVTRSQPDNSSPFLSVGYGTHGKWDDGAMGGATTVGFIKETNLANSSLKINSGTGTVNLEGDLGKAKALDTVNIESTGAVTLGNPNNTATTYHNGTVYADHGIYISGGTVSVGGEIHSGTTDTTSSASDITTRSDGCQNTAFQLDSVTIKSAGNLTVHGVESDGYTDSDGNLKGGKISLTSTGKTGTITLGAGVDYNGDATDGTLAAASAEQGAVVIDAQGSQGSLVNNTKGTDAITTGKDVTTGKYGTWQVYSASPDNNTFGTNLNSGTDAQWTSKSASNTIATENKYGKTPNGYSDTSSNKFIFQATPVITLYTDDYLKIYGDEVSADTLNKLLKGKEVFTGLDGKSHNVNDYSSAFQEDGYTKYISGEDTITVTSDGSTATATRTGGKYEATDKSGADHKNAVYDLTVNLNDAKALDGYAIDTENGKLEIKKRTASITGTGTQTYGDTDGTIKNWKDTQTNIADGSTVSYTTSIKSDSDYTKNKGSRNTADHGTYNDSVSFDGLKITDSNRNEVDIADNYDLTTTGTIDVAKAKLTVNPEDIHRIYGQATEVQKDAKTAYNLSGFANGDTKDTVDKEGKTIDQLVKVTNDVSKALKDNGTHTQNASAGGYDMETTASGDLTNYNIVIGDSKKVYLDKAELVIDTDSNSKVYGNWQGVKTDIEGAAHIRNAETAVVNGDKVSDLEKEMGLTTSSEALIKNADGTYKTNHVKDGGYAIDTKFADAIPNYTVKRGVAGTEILTKAKATVDTDNVTTTYGTVNKNYTSHFNTAVNGDNGDELLKQLKLSYSTDAYDKDGKPTNDVKEGGYDLLVTAKGSLDHDDYDVTVKNANVTLNKAKLIIDTDSNSKVYGDWQGVKSDVERAAHIRDVATSVVNGDDPTKLVEEMGLRTSSKALLQNADGTYKTNHVKEDGYAIKTEFLNTIKNYDVSRGTDGMETLTKAKAVVDTDKVTTTYGTVDKNYTSHFKGEVNGDDPAKLLEDLKLTYKTEAYKDDTYTNDVKDGGYTLDVEKTADLGDYDVTVNRSNVILNPKTIIIRNTMTQQYGSPEKTFSEATVPADQLANGDTISTKDLKFAIKSDGGYAESLAENKKNNSEAVTADVGTYTGELIHTGGGITHENGTDAYKNYKVTVEGDIVVTPAPLTITTKDVTTEYGTVKKTTSTATGLTNGDQNYASDIAYDYGDYGHGYLDDNTRTNNVGSYDITTNTTNTTSDFLKNYTISYGDATLTITPKDVYFHVDGKGSTFDDIVYTVTDPNHPGNRDAINSQLPYGETVTGGYGIGQALPDTPGSKEHYYTVDSTINGTPVYDNNGQGTQVGNYVYHPTGQAVIHFDQPQKPDQTTHYVEGAHRPQDKLESALPVFRVDASGVVKQYGTYGIESQSQAVTLSPTGMRMPEPNQTSTQDRKYLTTLKTAHGHGTFRLEYNGVVLRVIPVDPAAEQIVEDGDKLKNVALSEQALHAAYTQMGLDLVNLKGVYIYMAPM